MDELSPAERAKWALANPIIFGEYYIKPFDRRWNAPTADFHFAMIEFAMTHPKSVIHVPVEHAKSKWLSEVMPVWLTYNDRNLRGALLSNSARQAEGFMARIAWHFEHNHLLHRDFGGFAEGFVEPDFDERWNNQQIFVKRDPWALSKDPTWQALGTGGAIYGARLDVILCDDIIDLTNSQTPHVRNKVEDWFYTTLDSRLVDGGMFVVMGTMQHAEDLLWKLADDPEWAHFHLGCYYEDGTPIWPDQWPPERLEAKRRSIGTVRFRKIFMNDRKAQTGRFLKEEWLHFYDEAPPLDRMTIYMGLDPAVSDERMIREDRDPDYFVICIAGMDKLTKKVYILDFYRARIGFPKQQEVILEYFWRWKPVKVAIETNAYQKALAQAAWELPGLIPIFETKQTKDKATRFEAMAAHFENQRVLISRQHQDFIDEWIGFPDAAHDDLLDATEITLSMIRDLKTVPYSAKDVEPDYSFVEEQWY